MIRAALLILAIASPASADVWPAAISDPGMLQNMDFLYEKIESHVKKSTADATYTQDFSSRSVSVARVPTTATAQQTFGVSMASVTLTTHRATRIRIWYRGNVLNDSGATFVALVGFKQDNAFIDGMSSTVGASHARQLEATNGQPAGFHHVTESTLAAGTYTFAISIRADASGGNVSFVSNAALNNQFGAEEL